MKKFQASTHWHTDFSEQGVFEHLNRLTAFDEWRDWPSCQALAELLPYEVKNRNGKDIKFVKQKPTEDFSAVAYEEVIYETGKIPTRVKSWHDVFGALTWSLFPKTKAVVNQLHVDDIQKFGKQERTKQRNALTLFDECGVVLVTLNQSITSSLQEHQWQDAFVAKRELWHQASDDGVGVFQFGHANYEMLTKPFIGLTGKWLHLEMSASLLSLPLNVQYRLLDERLAAEIESGKLNDNRHLSPLPLLGVPGWNEQNESTDFYLNQEYFRPKPQPKG